MKYFSPAAHSIAGTCQRMSLGKTKLYELIRQGRLQVIKLGKKTLIAESEIQRFLAGQMLQANDDTELQEPARVLSRPIPASRRISARAQVAKGSRRALVGGAT